MKHMRKILALMIAVVMCMAMSVSVLAADDIKITIPEIENDSETHTYNAYQLFKADVTADPTVSNSSWGAALNSAALQKAFIEALKAGFPTNEAITALVPETTATATASSAGQVAGAIATIQADPQTGERDTAAAKSLAEVIGKFIKDNSVGATASANSKTDGNYVIDVTTAGNGYYFIADKDDNYLDSKDSAYTRYILEVIGNTSIAPKADVPKVVKKVQDKNDSTTGSAAQTSGTPTTTWHDSADYDVNDVIQYRIYGTLPSNYADYTGYNYKFSDTMVNGLDLNSSSVKVVAYPTVDAMEADTTMEGTGGTVLTPTNAPDMKVTADAHALTVEFETAFADNVWTKTGLKSVELPDDKEIDKNYVIAVYYTATINEDAVIGSAGNPNEVDLTFSNNPNKGGEGDTGKTPKDKNIVFTYKVIVNKIEKDTDTAPIEETAYQALSEAEKKQYIKDGDKYYKVKPLTGATFKLFKKYKDADSATAAGKTPAVKPEKGVDDSAWGTTNTWVEVDSVTISDSGTVADAIFAFHHLDDGEYLLAETVVPTGYTGMSAKAFTITAEHSDGDEPALTKLNDVTITEGAGTGKTTIVSANDATVTVAEDKADIETSILNQSGAVLPETGGIGTTAFYIIGAILVIGAGVVLVTRRRMSAN